MSEKTIVWIASYPKSGNTWLRCFLANMAVNSEVPVSGNDIYRVCTGDAVLSNYNSLKRNRFDPKNKYESASVRNEIIHAINSNQSRSNFVKTHFLNSKAYNQHLIDPSITKCAIYIIRDPRDVAASFAKFFEISIDAAISIMETDNFCLSSSKYAAAQFLGSWKQNVESWTQDTPDYGRLIIKYEDLIEYPDLCFRHIASVAGYEMDGPRIVNSIKNSDFNVLADHEMRYGFNELAGKKKETVFFRKGQVGNWKKELTEKQAQRIVDTNGRLMEKLGYAF